MKAITALRLFVGQRVPGHSLAALRILFGALMLAATLRFAERGWIDQIYVRPPFHFTYWGFGFVHPWPAPLLYAHFVLLGLAALFVALGLYYRVAIVSFIVLFGYVELLDVTTYLNHYYAITLVAILLAFMPAANVLSIDAWRARRRGRPLDPTVPRAAILMLQAQLGIVYFFAGLAKVQPDWLLHAEPLATWLPARTDAPIIGPLFAYPWVPFAMSWAGALFDLTIPLWLSLSRTRLAAYGVVIAFHVVTWELFQIGMFPWIMIGLTPIFFAPDWPLRFLRRRPPEPTAPRPIARVPLAAMIVWLTVQLALPLRHYLYPGNVLETEQGFRWAWHVMVVERAGIASFRVVGADGRLIEEVSPSRELTSLQQRMMATQPDMILQYAHHLRDQHPGERVRVYADVFVSTNGRPSRRLVDPTVDLAAEEDTILGYAWVLTE